VFSFINHAELAARIEELAGYHELTFISVPNFFGLACVIQKDTDPQRKVSTNGRHFETDLNQVIDLMKRIIRIKSIHELTRQQTKSKNSNKRNERIQKGIPAHHREL
jgi:hypothetical protein